MNTIEFQSAGIKLVGNLYLPSDFSEDNRYPTIVMTPPAHQVKEQTPAVYGPKFAEQGFVFLAFDYNSKGESDSYQAGFRNDEHGFRKQEDLRNAISYLCDLPFVDKQQLFGVGVCGGGTIMSSVLITDLRVKAFASISAMLATDALFFSSKEAFSAMMNTANQSRQRMYSDAEAESIYLFGYDDPEFLEKNPELTGAQLEGYDYYGTRRAGSETYPHFSNKVLGNIYETAVINIGEQYADRMQQPFLGIVGEKADTAFATELFFEKVTAPKMLYRVPNASHVDLYDVDEYVDIAVDKVSTFFTNVES